MCDKNTICLWCKKPLRKFSKKGFKPIKVHLKCYKIWKINEDLKIKKNNNRCINCNIEYNKYKFSICSNCNINGCMDCIKYIDFDNNLCNKCLKIKSNKI